MTPELDLRSRKPPKSRLALLNLDNEVPDHTTISRRKAKLGKVTFYENRRNTPIHILIDTVVLRFMLASCADPQRAGTIGSSICVSTSGLAKSSPAS